MEVMNTMTNTNNAVMSLHKREYTKTEKCYQAWEKQEKKLETNINNNKQYWEEFSTFKFPEAKQKGSLAQYKCSIFNFMEFIEKDLCLVTQEDIDNFVATIDNYNTINNKIAHIKSILTYIVQNNTENCLERISKDTLILIISI